MRYPKFLDDLMLFKKSQLDKKQLTAIQKYKNKIENKPDKFNPGTVSKFSVGGAFLCEWIITLIGEKADNAPVPKTPAGNKFLLPSGKASPARSRNKHARNMTVGQGIINDIKK
jgi:hypothetical protein